MLHILQAATDRKNNWCSRFSSCLNLVSQIRSCCCCWKFWLVWNPDVAVYNFTWMLDNASTDQSPSVFIVRVEFLTVLLLLTLHLLGSQFCVFSGAKRLKINTMKGPKWVNGWALWFYQLPVQECALMVWNSEVLYQCQDWTEHHMVFYLAWI